MKKVKITIFKTTLDKELAAEYGIDGLTACPMMKAGNVFYADYAKPQGFCDEAWKAIYQYVFALAHGADKSLFYYGDWIKKPGVAIVSCNDGLRPVIMKLEATDEESKIDYEPVERESLPSTAAEAAMLGCIAFLREGWCLTTRCKKPGTRRRGGLCARGARYSGPGFTSSA